MTTPTQTPRPSKGDIKRYRSNYQGEIDGVALYQRLAAAEKDPERAQIFLELAETEKRHVRVWAERLRAAGIEPAEARRTGLAEVRGTIAGFPLGLGVALLTLGSYQTLIQLALGAAWLFVGFGRFVSILSDRGGTILNWLLLLFNLALAALCLAPAFGLVSA